MMEKRRLTKEDIDKVRDIEGFPIGTDEDIIALSDAPYYTACPNPFIEEFIKENGHPYDEETDDYHREPFAADVSEGKTDPVYMAHAYHTKVPYKAILKYILHYTVPGDVVLDGFCGSGMTGIAAQKCGDVKELMSLGLTKEEIETNLGARNAILNDLAPIATFISNCFNNPENPSDYSRAISSVIEECKKEFAWMFKTKHSKRNEPNFLFDTDSHEQYEDVEYTVWSDVLICPTCGKEIVLWNAAVDLAAGKISDFFYCPHCNTSLKKKDCKHAQLSYYDDALNEVRIIAKQVPVLINYSFYGKRYDKKPDAYDLELLQKIDEYRSPYHYPIGLLPEGCNTGQPKLTNGIYYVHQFYTKRNLVVLSAFIEKLSQKRQIITATASMQRSSKMYKYKLDHKFGTVTGTLYIPSLGVESTLFSLLERKARDIAKAYSFVQGSNNTIIQCASADDLSTVPDNSVDYIFTDPPFGANINYSELSFIWEAWLGVVTNNRPEAIMNSVQKKGIGEYQDLMTKCFSEYHRIIKPNRWMTVEFHNSKNSVWNAIQEALLKAGFVIADVRTLDKKQSSFKQVTTSTAVKQDLVISAYKPTESFSKEFKLKAGTEKTAWVFVRQHLSNLPITVKRGGQLEVISERQAFLLWDRMVAYHIMQGIAVPMDAADFYRGLDEKFLKRDNMYFLPSQVNQYDQVRATCDVENIQLSLFVSDEKSAIGWLYQELDESRGNGAQTYQDLMPKFMQQLKAVDKREKLPELSVILEENFLKDEKGKWYIPDYTKSGDIAKLREKNLLKEFAEYQKSKGKLKVFRSEAIRAGFAKLWKDKNYSAIIEMAERLPAKTIQEDSNLLMYYDNSLGRAESVSSQTSMNIT